MGELPPIEWLDVPPDDAGRHRRRSSRAALCAAIVTTAAVAAGATVLLVRDDEGRKLTGTLLLTQLGGGHAGGRTDCRGTGVYADISTRSAVEITDDSGAVVATAPLRHGTTTEIVDHLTMPGHDADRARALLAEFDETTSVWIGPGPPHRPIGSSACFFLWEAEVKDASAYSVAAKAPEGGVVRDIGRYTHEALEAADWTVVFNLGSYNPGVTRWLPARPAIADGVSALPSS